MRLKHEFEWREGQLFYELQTAMASIPPAALNVKMGFEEETVGYGYSEETRPYLVLSWETEE